MELAFLVIANPAVARWTVGSSMMLVSFEPGECAAVPAKWNGTVEVPFRFTPNATAGEPVWFWFFAAQHGGTPVELAAWTDTPDDYLHVAARFVAPVRTGGPAFDLNLELKSLGNGPVRVEFTRIDQDDALRVALPDPVEMPRTEPTKYVRFVAESTELGRHSLAIRAAFHPARDGAGLPPDEQDVHATLSHQYDLVGKIPAPGVAFLAVLLAGAALARRARGLVRPR